MHKGESSYNENSGDGYEMRSQSYWKEKQRDQSEGHGRGGDMGKRQGKRESVWKPILLDVLRLKVVI